MLKEKLQEYALIAEIIGGIAIVASLVFVGLQIRQNSEVTEINAYQLLVSQIMALNAQIVQDTELALLLNKVKTGETLDAVETEKFFRFSGNLIRHGDMSWQLYQRGVIDERTLQSMLGIMLGHMDYPAFRENWEGGRLTGNLATEFMSYVENFYLQNQVGTASPN